MKTSKLRKNRMYVYGILGAIILLLVFTYGVLPSAMEFLAWRLPENFEFIAKQHIKEGRTKQAEKILLRAAKKRPWDFRPHQMLGEMMIEDDFNKGMKHLQKAARLAFNATGYPDMMSPYHRKRLGQLYYTLAENLQKKDPDNPPCFYYTYSALLDDEYKQKTASLYGKMLKEKYDVNDWNLLNSEYEITRFYFLSDVDFPGWIDHHAFTKLSHPFVLKHENLRTTPPPSARGMYANQRDINLEECMIELENAEFENGILAFYRDGFVKYKLTADDSIDRKLSIIARGTSAFEIPPVIEFDVNGENIGYEFIDGNVWRLFPIPVKRPSSEPRTLTIRFLNDGALPVKDEQGNVEKFAEDRNVFIAGIYL